jgi:hypothetical protein
MDKVRALIRSSKMRGAAHKLEAIVDNPKLSPALRKRAQKLLDKVLEIAREAEKALEK